MNCCKHLAAVAAIALTAALQAANISYEVQVAGYSKAGWIKVRPELRWVLGGRVANLPQYGGWVTDRVARQETIRTTISPSRPAERKCRGAIVGVYVPGEFVAFESARLPLVDVRTVTLNPRYDNIHTWAITEAGYFEQRVPIGTRPR